MSESIYSLGTGGAATESIDDIFSFPPIDYSIVKPIGNTNQGLSPRDTSGETWEKWFGVIQGAATTLRNVTDTLSGKTDAKTTIDTDSGKTYQSGQPISNNMKIGLGIGAAIIGVFLVVKLVK